MAEPLSHTAFFGDGERKFALPYSLIKELERETKAGIGALSDRLIHRHFGIVDLEATIRLALIGGGESPERANELVETYVHGRPLTETLPVAIAIIEILWFGDKPQDEKAPE